LWGKKDCTTPKRRGRRRLFGGDTANAFSGLKMDVGKIFIAKIFDKKFIAIFKGWGSRRLIFPESRIGK